MKFVAGGWCIAQHLPLFSDVKTTMEKSLPKVQWEDYKSKINEQILANKIIKEDLANKVDLVNRIEILENRQTHQMV